MTLTANLKRSQVTNQQVEAVIQNSDYYDQMTSMGRRFKDLDDDCLESIKYQAAWIALATYDPNRGAKFNTHLVGHMRFLCLKELRRMHGSNNQYKNTLHDELSLMNVHDSMTIGTYDDIDKIDFYNALDNLSKDEKRILYSHYEDKKSLQEIANEEGLTKQAISQRLRKIREKIRMSCDM